MKELQQKKYERKQRCCLLDFNLTLLYMLCLQQQMKWKSSHALNCIYVMHVHTAVGFRNAFIYSHPRICFHCKQGSTELHSPPDNF